MNQEFLSTGLDKQLCEALGCNDKATSEIQVKVGQNGLISLFVCERCIHKFSHKNMPGVHNTPDQQDSRYNNQRPRRNVISL